MVGSFRRHIETQPCFCDGDGPDGVRPVLVERDAFAVDEFGDAWPFEGQHGIEEGKELLQPRGAAKDGHLEHFVCAAELTLGFALLQSADCLCE